LARPADGVAYELDPVLGVELPDRLEEPLVAARHQLTQVESMSLVALHVGQHEAQVGGHESLGGGRVSVECAAGQALLLGGVVDHRELLDVQEILIDRCAGSGTTKCTNGGNTGASHTSSSEEVGDSGELD